MTAPGRAAAAAARDAQVFGLLVGMDVVAVAIPSSSDALCYAMRAFMSPVSTEPLLAWPYRHERTVRTEGLAGNLGPWCINELW